MSGIRGAGARLGALAIAGGTSLSRSATSFEGATGSGAGSILEVSSVLDASCVAGIAAVGARSDGASGSGGAGRSVAAGGSAAAPPSLGSSPRVSSTAECIGPLRSSCRARGPPRSRPPCPRLAAGAASSRCPARVGARPELPAGGAYHAERALSPTIVAREMASGNGATSFHTLARHACRLMSRPSFPPRHPRRTARRVRRNGEREGSEARKKPEPRVPVPRLRLDLWRCGSRFRSDA